MCGIVGIVGQTGVIDRSTLHRMCQTIVHRGPDDGGIYSQGSVGLGIRRLSIIDLVDGRQPIHNEDRTVWLVFNGEIYNYPQLRKELEGRGHRFYTHSDTEVIVHLYEEMGADCVRKLRGMFAFALYDERHHSLLLARDRLGKKPLHYAVDRGQLLFGSEIKAILAAAPQLMEPNPEALLQYFYFGYIPDPLTAFRQIKKLPPGNLLEYVNGQLEIRQYWDLPTYGSFGVTSEEECLQELEERLEEAVRIRLVSDVPLGALLSGGVDSSLVVALMARSGTSPVKTFCIDFANQDFSEAKYARAVAKRFGTDHQELLVEPRIQETLDFLTRTLEEPFGDSSMVPTYHVCRLAKQQVAVALSGDGGDELFAGYDRYSVHLNRERFDRVPEWAGHYFRRYIYPRLSDSLYGRRYAFNISLSPRDRYLDSVSYLPVFDRERSLFSEELLSWGYGCPSPTVAFAKYFDNAPASDALSRLLYLDTKTYLTADILAKVDRMSMLNSLEVRSPLLDHIFVEWITQLPASLKLHSGVRKYILKKLALRVGVPSEVVHRPKQGFALPLVHWWRRELKDEMLAILVEPQTLQRGYFNPSAVRHILSEHLNGRRDRSHELWLLLVFEMWHRNFLQSNGGAKSLSNIQIGHRPLVETAMPSEPDDRE